MSSEQTPQIIFPVTIDVKIVMEHPSNTKATKAEILAICKEYCSAASFNGTKESGGGRYISFTYNVKIENHSLFRALYAKLGELPGVKLII